MTFQGMESYLKSESRTPLTELAWCSSSVMDCHVMARGSIPGGNGVKTELHLLHKGQKMGVPSLNELTVDGM